MILNFIWKGEELRIVKTTLKKKKKVGGFILLDFNIYYKATVIKTVDWHHIAKRHRSIAKIIGEKRIWNPERLHIHG